mmetsp:Transcript_74119/g.130827  ORF Transcript_74119/g.130827 Transcript_74119/m.130827 type:complete len:230 (+) Transcript_74119:1156-1845(+)
MSKGRRRRRGRRKKEGGQRTKRKWRRRRGLPWLQRNPNPHPVQMIATTATVESSPRRAGKPIGTATTVTTVAVNLQSGCRKGGLSKAGKVRPTVTTAVTQVANERNQRESLTLLMTALTQRLIRRRRRAKYRRKKRKKQQRSSQQRSEKQKRRQRRPKKRRRNRKRRCEQRRKRSVKKKSKSAKKKLRRPRRVARRRRMILTMTLMRPKARRRVSLTPTARHQAPKRHQ